MTSLINAVFCLSPLPQVCLYIPAFAFLFLFMFGILHFVFALLTMVRVCIQHLLGLGRRPMGQFSVLLALCHRVLLISTFFPPPLRPSREVVLVTSLIVNNRFQWEQTGCRLYAPLQVRQCRSGTFRGAGWSTGCPHCYLVGAKMSSCLLLVNDSVATNDFFY